MDQTESPFAWLRLAAAVLLSTIGCVGMWSFVVALPAVQSDFQIARADATLPYTLAMVGFSVGGVLMGRLADRFGILVPVFLGAIALSLGYIASGLAMNIWQLATAHGILIGIGTSAVFGPLIAEVSQWFTRNRGIAVALCASGNYLAGAIWPPLVQHFIDVAGWRQTHIGIGVFCAVTMPLLALPLKGPARTYYAVAGKLKLGGQHKTVGISPNALQALLTLAALTCCVAMAMPQVHIVAYCGDLGYGVARGAEMLSLMLGFGIVSRITSGWIADRLGGVATLLLGSTLQALALFLYAVFDGLMSLYVISALFGLFQGGIIPSYAMIVREYFPPREAGTRVGIVLLASSFGMALGGWMSGAIFDLTGSYRAAFVNGILWNLLNMAIALWLLRGLGRRRIAAAQA